MVKVATLSNEIAKQLRQFTNLVEEEVELAKEEVTKEAVSLLKQNSPESTGSYRKGWRRKKVGKDIIIHNATDYQLTHLLENGHVKSGGGRVPSKVHIRPVEERIVREFEERVERAIEQ
jgi:hypothetical protein